MGPSERDSFFASQPSDDETLFAFYQILRHKPLVVIVYRSFREADQGGPTYVTREMETGFAMSVAGVEWEQWEYPDNQPVWLHDSDFREAVRGCDTIIGPAFEEGGHEQHNAVANLLNAWRDPTMVRYLSYVRGHGRSEGVEVIPTPEEAALKQRALMCYASQAAYPPTAPWFGDDQREFVAS